MTKVVGIDGGKKNKDADRCPFCGKEPACYGWSCPRIKVAEQDSDGGWMVEYWPVPWPDKDADG